MIDKERRAREKEQKDEGYISQKESMERYRKHLTYIHGNLFCHAGTFTVMRLNLLK